MRRIGMAIAVFLIATGPVFADLDRKSGTEDEEPKKHFLYQWTDDTGNVHITDTPGKVPEQYRSRMKTMEAPRAEERAAPERREPVHSYDYDKRREALEKARWQNRLRDWKQRQQNAEKRYEDLGRQREELFRAWGSAALAPIENRLKAEQIEEQMRAVQNEIEAARNMVEEVIPEEARKADVPPGWLREVE